MIFAPPQTAKPTEASPRDNCKIRHGRARYRESIAVGKSTNKKPITPSTKRSNPMKPVALCLQDRESTNGRLLFLAHRLFVTGRRIGGGFERGGNVETVWGSSAPSSECARADVTRTGTIWPRSTRDNRAPKGTSICTISFRSLRPITRLGVRDRRTPPGRDSPSINTCALLSTSDCRCALCCLSECFKRLCEPRFFDLFGHVIGQVLGGGLRANRVLEPKERAESRFGDQRECLREVVVGLSRKADDHVGRNRDVRARRLERAHSV